MRYTEKHYKEKRHREGSLKLSDKRHRAAVFKRVIQEAFLGNSEAKACRRQGTCKCVLSGVRHCLGGFTNRNLFLRVPEAGSS